MAAVQARGVDVLHPPDGDFFRAGNDYFHALRDKFTYFHIALESELALHKKEIRETKHVRIEEVQVRIGGERVANSPGIFAFPYIDGYLALGFDPKTSQLDSIQFPREDGTVVARALHGTATMLERHRVTIVIPPFDEYGRPSEGFALTISPEEFQIISPRRENKDTARAVMVARQSLGPSNIFIG
jgi:hypothetical protein